MFDSFRFLRLVFQVKCGRPQIPCCLGQYILCDARRSGKNGDVSVVGNVAGSFQL
jgi:hypothetical protein